MSHAKTLKYLDDDGSHRMKAGAANFVWCFSWAAKSKNDNVQTAR